jgi:hypothetical protein
LDHWCYTGLSELYGWFLTNLAVFRCICSTCFIWVFCWGFQIGVAYSTIGQTGLWYASSMLYANPCNCDKNKKQPQWNSCLTTAESTPINIHFSLELLPSGTLCQNRLCFVN